MIKIETCRGCGRSIYVHPVANLTVRLDVEPLDAQEAVTALIAGRNLWRVTATSVTGARPAELSALRQRGTTEGPCIVQEHACTGRLNAASVPLSASQTAGGGKVPPKAPGPSVALQRAFSGQPTASSTPDSAPDASRKGPQPLSDARTVPCSTCGASVPLGEPEGYVLIHLGATLIDAFHATCP